MFGSRNNTEGVIEKHSRLPIIKLKKSRSANNIQENIAPEEEGEISKEKLQGKVFRSSGSSDKDAAEACITTIDTADLFALKSTNVNEKKPRNYIGSILRRASSFNLKKKSVQEEASIELPVVEPTLEDGEEVHMELQTCYRQFKATNIDDLFTSLVPNKCDMEDDVVTLDDKFSFTSDSIFSFSSAVSEEEFLNVDKDDGSTESEIFSFQDTTTTENKRSTGLKSKLKTILVKLNSGKSVGTLETKNLFNSDLETEEFTPVEIKIPVFRSANSKIPTIVSELVDGNIASASFSAALESVVSPDNIRFEQHANILVYDGNSSCRSRKKVHVATPDSFYGFNSSLNNALSLKRSTSSMLSENSEFSNNCHSILKTKFNKNADQEIYRAQCCDDVEIDEFIDIFEKNEMLRMLQEPSLGMLRQRQILGYYNSMCID